MARTVICSREEKADLRIKEANILVRRQTKEMRFLQKYRLIPRYFDGADLNGQNSNAPSNDEKVINLARSIVIQFESPQTNFCF